MSIRRSAPLRALIVLALATAGCSGDDADTNGVGSGPTELTGYWLWVQQVEDGQVVADNLDGPWSQNGWMKLAFGSTGRAHIHYNVDTGSDYQTPGTYSIDGDLVHYVGTEHYSCAHPDQVDADERSRYFRFRLDGGRLWVSQTGFQGFDLPFAADPPVEPARWVVYRPLTRDEYYQQYDLRLCQPTATAPACHPGCSSDSLVD